MKHNQELQYNVLIESRLTRLETIAENQVNMIREIKDYQNKLDMKLDTIFTRLDSKIDKHFFWTIGLIVMSFGMPMVMSIMKTLHFIV